MRPPQTPGLDEEHDERRRLKALAREWVPERVDAEAFAASIVLRQRRRRARAAMGVGGLAAAASVTLWVALDDHNARGPVAVDAPEPELEAPAVVPVAAEGAAELRLLARDPWLERAVGDPADPRDLPGEYGALARIYLAVDDNGGTP